MAPDTPSRGSCEPHRDEVDLPEAALEPGRRQPRRRGAEGTRIDDVSARGGAGAVQRGDTIRAFEDPGLQRSSSLESGGDERAARPPSSSTSRDHVRAARSTGRTAAHQGRATDTAASALSAKPSAPSAGWSTAIAAFIACAAVTSSGRKNSPSSHRRPASRIPGTRPSSIAWSGGTPALKISSATPAAAVSSPSSTARRSAWSMSRMSLMAHRRRASDASPPERGIVTPRNGLEQDVHRRGQPLRERPAVGVGGPVRERQFLAGRHAFLEDE